MNTEVKRLRENALNEIEKVANQIHRLIQVSAILLIILIVSLILVAFQILRPIERLTKELQKRRHFESTLNQFSYRHKDEFALLVKAIKQFRSASTRVPDAIGEQEIYLSAPESNTAISKTEETSIEAK